MKCQRSVIMYVCQACGIRGHLLLPKCQKMTACGGDWVLSVDSALLCERQIGLKKVRL